MARRILIPIEGSERDDDALAMARHIARDASASIVLIHVAPPTVRTRDLIEMERFLDGETQALRSEGIEAHFVVEFGEPAAEIADAARRQGAEMIVLAPEQRAFLETLWRPHVSVGLLGHATTPLLVLPGGDGEHATPALLSEPDAKVILALDGSKSAEAALPMAMQLAQINDRTLMLVRVVESPLVLGMDAEAVEVQREARLAAEAEAHAYLAETKERLTSETSLEVETVERTGQAAEQLIRLAGTHRGSVLVMGTHGRGSLARVIIGSVAAEVLRHTPGPLVIVPSRPERAAPKA